MMRPTRQGAPPDLRVGWRGPSARPVRSPRACPTGLLTVWAPAAGERVRVLLGSGRPSPREQGQTRVAGAVLDLDDWIDIFGLRRTLDELRAGAAYPAQVRTVIDARRGRYHGVMGDYVRVLEQLHGYVDRVVRAIGDQNDTLEAFNDAIADAGMHFTWDPARLLNEGERGTIRRIEERLHEMAAAAEEAAEEAAGAIAEMEEMLEELESQLAEMEGAAAEIEEAIADLEEALGEAQDDG